MILNCNVAEFLRLATVLIVSVIFNISLGAPTLAQSAANTDQTESRVTAAMGHLQHFQVSHSLDDLKAASNGLYSAANVRTIKSADIVARRRSVVAGFAQVLHQIDLQSDPSFDVTDLGARPSACVPPPAEPSGRQLPPCSDPNFISDPATRSKYIDSINANKLKVQQYNRNVSLHYFDDEVMQDIKSVLQSFRSRAPKDDAALDSILRQADISSARRAKIDAML